MVLLNHKKSQIETIGLVIIVILIAFIFIISLFFITKPRASLNENYLKLNADNLRSTILKTNLCQNISIKDEIINCNSGFFLCNNLNSCQDLNNVIKDIIENSVRNNYEFSAGNIVVKKDICREVQASSIQPLANTNIEVSLKLCS